MSNYSEFFNTEIEAINSTAVENGTGESFTASAGAVITPNIFTNVTQGDVVSIEHNADATMTRLIQIQEYDGSSYKRAKNSDYKIYFDSSTATRIKKLSAGTVTSLRINILT